MASIPVNPMQALVDLIYEGYEREAAKKRLGKGVFLARLGASSLGAACPRQTFFDWRAYSRGYPRGQMLRLFDTGHQQEARVVADLRQAGLEVWDIDSETGKQFTYVDEETGHFVCKIDGIVKGVPGFELQPHLLEIKTHNHKRFGEVNRRGVEDGYPEHYFQCQAGMWVTKTTAALYLGLNKDDEGYYPERLLRDDAYIEKKVKSRIRTMVDATLIPAGISTDASAYGCGFCGQQKVCLGSEPLKNCRTCKKCEPASEGIWLCHLWQKTLNWDDQRAACDRWDPLKAERI